MSASCLRALAGLLFTVVVNGLLLYGGHTMARGLLGPARASVRLAAAVMLWLALALALFWALAPVGLLVPGAAAIGAVALVAAIHAAWGRHRGIGSELRAASGWLRALLGSRGAALVVGAGVLALSAAWRAAVWPPLSLDSLTYHNYLAGSWVQAGGLTRLSLPQAMEGYAWLPAHFEALVAWAMLPFHGDFLANFVSFPVLALGALSVYALCREMDLDLHDASLAAALVCLSPAVFAYVCTQYSDILVMSLLVTGALFMVRHLREGRWADALLVFLAAGLAVGTKHTAIPAAGLLCLIVLWRAARERAARWRRAGALAVACAALVAAFGGHVYVRNWLVARNPLYPTTVRLLGRDLFPQAPVVFDAAEQVGRGGWREDLGQLARSVTYVASDQGPPQSWGPKLPGLALLAVLALWLARGLPRRAELRCLALCWAVPALLFYLDPSANTAAIRRFWPDAFCRFLAAPVALVTVSALVGVASLASGRARRILRGGLCVLALYDVLAMFLLPDTGRVLLIVGCGLAVAAAGLMLASRLEVRRATRLALAALGLAAVASGVCGLQWVRDRWRNWFFETRTELHPFMRHWVAGWAFCDEPGQPKTIALASYEPRLGHHWFFYPLMGRRLQNRVAYVPTDRPLEQAAEPRTVAPPGQPDRALWLANLAELAPTHLFVQLDPAHPADDPARQPVELQWARSAPRVFQLVHSGDRHRVYEVALPRPAAP